MLKDAAYVLERMRYLCSRREYAVSDIRKKVSAAVEDREEVDKIISSLIDDKYLDDARYACAYVRDKSSISGWGETKIRYMLSAKGISRDVINSALEEIDDSKAGQRLEKLLENKFRSLKDDPQCRLKILRFALGRGYSYDDVIPYIDKLIKNCN